LKDLKGQKFLNLGDCLAKILTLGRHLKIFDRYCCCCCTSESPPWRRQSESIRLYTNHSNQT